MQHWETWVARARDHKVKRIHLPWLPIVPKRSKCKMTVFLLPGNEQKPYSIWGGYPWRPKTGTHWRHHRSWCSHTWDLTPKYKATFHTNASMKGLFSPYTRDFLYGAHALNNLVYKVNFGTIKVFLPLSFIMKLKMCSSWRKKLSLSFPVKMAEYVNTVLTSSQDTSKL